MADTEHQQAAGAPALPGYALDMAASALTRLIREYTGRGPTRCRVFVSQDVLVCVAYDTLTKGERRLVEHGEVAQVLAMRRSFQSAMEDEAVAAIESSVGRKV